MAPESILKSEKLEPKSESWSIGIILHELLTYEQPFIGDTEDDLICKILTVDIEYDNEKWEDFDYDTIDLVESLLQKNPKNRMNVLDILKHSCFSNKNVSQKVKILDYSRI